MRTLTDAQRLTEDYRDADRHQNLVRRRLLADLIAVIRTNAAITDAARTASASSSAAARRRSALGLLAQPSRVQRVDRISRLGRAIGAAGCHIVAILTNQN